MVQRQADPRITEIPASLLQDPLAYLRAEHQRKREVCEMIDAIAARRRPSRRMARFVLAYIAGPLALHVRDEEEDLFPALRRRCMPDDEIDDLFGQLSRDHAGIAESDEELLRGLEAIAAGEAPADRTSFGFAAARFTAEQRRHIGYENNIVLPLARKRLRKSDWRAIARNMTDRHEAARKARAADDARLAGVHAGTATTSAKEEVNS
jgi:hemerythrin-like domain-containing protein